VPLRQVEYRPMTDFHVPRLSVCRGFIGMNAQFFVGLCGTPVAIAADGNVH
jgi:hypothetical protein